MPLHFLGVQSVSVGLFRVPRTRIFVLAIEGAHVGRFLPRATLPMPAPQRGGGLVWWPRQCWSGGSSPSLLTRLLSPFTQVRWGKPASNLHCSEELFFSALSQPLSSLLQGRGQVNFIPGKILSSAVRDGLTLTHSMRVFRDALCRFAPSTPEFVLQAQGVLPSSWHTVLHVTLLGGVGGLWAALPHLWSCNAAAEALGRAASSPVLPTTQATQLSRTEELRCTTCEPYRGSPAEPAGRRCTLDLLPGSKPIQLWGHSYVSPCGGAEASAVVAPAPDPSVTCHLLPQELRSSGQVPVCSQRLAALLKASVLTGPP